MTGIVIVDVAPHDGQVRYRLAVLLRNSNRPLDASVPAGRHPGAPGLDRPARPLRPRRVLWSLAHLHDDPPFDQLHLICSPISPSSILRSYSSTVIAPVIGLVI